MIYDVISYNGEKEMLKLRMEILHKHVDKFVIVEAPTTFSGFPKPLYFQKHMGQFKRFENKINYHVIDEIYSANEVALADSSPNTTGASHWKREFLQKEWIKRVLIHLKDDDICYIGDADEIWEPSYSPEMGLEKLKLRVYAYYLDNRSNEAFWGTLRGKWRHIKGQCLNTLRSDTSLRGREYAGWHFTSMGGLAEVRRKLNDSYTAESYNTYDVQEKLPKRVREGKDYLGRPFEFKVEEYEWPQYLHDHRREYAHLCKGFELKL